MENSLYLVTVNYLLGKNKHGDHHNTSLRIKKLSKMKDSVELKEL